MQGAKQQMERAMVGLCISQKITSLITFMGRKIEGMSKSQARIYLDKVGVVKAGSPEGGETVVKAMRALAQNHGPILESFRKLVKAPNIDTSGLLQRSRRIIDELLFHEKMDPTKREALKLILDEILNPANPIMSVLHVYMAVCAETARARSGNKLSEEDLLGVFLSSGGPVLIKVMQMLANDHLRPKGNEERIKRLTANVFTATPALAQMELDFLWKNTPSMQSRLQCVESEPLGVASIGEVHMAYLKNGEKRVLKFVRPISALGFLLECAVLVTSVLPKMSASSDGKSGGTVFDLLINLASGMFAEFDLQKEAEWSQTLGKEYEEQSGGIIKCAKTEFASGENGEWQCSIQELATGKTVKSILASNPPESVLKRLRPLIENVADVWSYTSLRGSKSFHADLHPGNMYVDDDFAHVTLIDFGAADKLSNADHCYIFKLFMMFFLYRLKRGGLKDISKAIKGFCQLDESGEQQVNAVVEKMFRGSPKPTLSNVMQEVFKEINDMRNCARLPIVQYVRGSDMLEGVLNAVGAVPIEQIVIKRAVGGFRLGMVGEALKSLRIDCAALPEAFMIDNFRR